jgi:phosphatidylinositol-3-phosphatase
MLSSDSLRDIVKKPIIFIALLVGLISDLGHASPARTKTQWPGGLPVYDHVVIVVEENKDYDQIIDNPLIEARYINSTLRKEGANFTRMYGEEHHSQGNYFWLFSGSNQCVGFDDRPPFWKIHAPNLGAALIAKRLSFKGYAENLPAIGSDIDVFPEKHSLYARKHVPWISFDDIPNGDTVATSSNLRFEDFPRDPAGFSSLPTVAFVIPNLKDDMHDDKPKESVPRGDTWLKTNIDPYYQWAKSNNSLLILTFDENDDQSGGMGLTDPSIVPCNQRQKDQQNRIYTVFAGAHIRPGEYSEGNGITHVNILRTLEAMYGLPRCGYQQPNALRAGIGEDLICDVFKAN